MEYTRTIQKERENSPEKFGKERERRNPREIYFSPSFHHEAQGNKEKKLFSKVSNGSQSLIIAKEGWSSSLPTGLRRTPSQNHLRQHQLKQEVMEKMRQELKTLRKLPWPLKLTPLKGNDHRGPAFRWSLLILFMELRRNGLEVGESIY